MVSSSGHSQENNVTLTENAPRCLHNASTNNNIQSEQAVNPVPECEPAVTTEASASAAPYAHLDILNRYKKLCAATGNKVRPNLAADVTSGKCGSSDQTTTRTVSSLPSDASQEYETPGPAVVTSVREVNKHLHIKGKKKFSRTDHSCIMSVLGEFLASPSENCPLPSIDGLFKIDK